MKDMGNWPKSAHPAKGHTVNNTHMVNMEFTKEQRASFRELTTALIKWLNDNCASPHVSIIVTNTDAELLEGAMAVYDESHLRDKLA